MIIWWPVSTYYRAVVFSFDYFMFHIQLDVASKYIRYHTEKFGYSKANVDFKLGYIENLQEAGVDDECCDLIM